jgi:hypothetical protein
MVLSPLEKRTKRIRSFASANRLIARVRPSPKLAARFDYSKIVPIVLSVVAVTISYFSWRESHKNTVRNEELNRPILVLDGFEAYATENPQIVEFRIRVKNIGKNLGRILATKTSARQYQFETCETLYDNDTGIAEDQVVNSGFPPGMSRTLTYHASLSKDCPTNVPMKFNFHILLDYKSEGDERQYSQFFDEPFEITLVNLKRRFNRTYAPLFPQPQSSNQNISKHE